MAQPLSIENGDWVYLITTRTAGSKLWFLNNRELEQLILGALARYQAIYGVIIYGFIIMGNHYHLLAKFPNRNRALFMRDFNSAIARLVGRHVGAHGRRSLWARRYSYQVLLRDEDIRHWFFYIALNAVSSGIVRFANEYLSYNSFFDLIKGDVRVYRWINWSEFLMKNRYNTDLKPEDFSKEYSLVLSMPPNEDRHDLELYRRELLAEFKEKEALIARERREVGKGYLGIARLRKQVAGASPQTTKTSSRNSFRPLVLTLCYETKRTFLDLYFSIQEQFKQASELFRAGDFSAIFPEGTYPPPRLVVA